MVLGGLWHGAAWNFVAWGFYHGLLLVAHRSLGPTLARVDRAAQGPLKAPWFLLRLLVMFHLTCYGWLLFRAISFTQIANKTTALLHTLERLPSETFARVALLCAPVVFVQVVQYRAKALEFMRQPWLPIAGRAVVYAVMFYCTVFRGAAPKAFVYFQF
jgi:D-alanyl-lipoteichoic acid acyltransferase DltB (MBOAT superfamily)